MLVLILNCRMDLAQDPFVNIVTKRDFLGNKVDVFAAQTK